MAPAALLLSAAHRSAQSKLNDAVAVTLLRSYLGLITPGVKTDIATRWIETMIPSIFAYRTRSEALASTFYDRSRYLAFPDAPEFAGVDLDPLPEEQIATSLSVTGLVGLRQKLDAGMPEAQALQEAGDAAAAAAGKHALNGGREIIERASSVDKLAVGYFRETKSGCCSFCAMLASRGAIFKGDSFDDSDPRFIGPGEVKVHDKCTCGFVPVFSRSSALPDLSGQFKTLWTKSTEGYSGKDALNAFRRAYAQSYPDVSS